MQNTFKQYQRNRRQLTLEQDFSKGMMFNESGVDFSYTKLMVNYDNYNDRGSLIPRAGLQLSGLVLPQVKAESFDSPVTSFCNSSVDIKAVRECTEVDGQTYDQFILGQVHEDSTTGKIYVVTVPLTDAKYSSNALENFELNLGLMEEEPPEKSANYYTVDLKEIHGIPLKENSQACALIGCFAFGNSFYFLNSETGEGLCRTVFSQDEKKYVIETITPKTIDPAEAVTYGYNMLLGDTAYDFKNSTYDGNVIQLTGILPYDPADSTNLLMTPKKNQEVLFKCFCKVPEGKAYKLVWEWRTVEDSEWTKIDESTYQTITEEEVISVRFIPPSEDIMVRVQAYSLDDETIVEKAMTVGFDFSIDELNANVAPEVYDLSTAKGVAYWKNRLVLWGVEADPTILFLSDVNEPAYFPYPNNITIFDDPIIEVKTYLDSLLVFTTNQVFQVDVNAEGVGWTTTLLQSNLRITPWDKHLIQIVRNMVFFKSGNYYYMIVPKAQSTTGELTLAPISTPVIDFFNKFEKNIEDILYEVFEYEGNFNVVHYYNFLDYEDVHNMYVIDYEDEKLNNYLHLDVVYNTVSRVWKIYTFDAPYFLHPCKNDATQKGTLTATSLTEIVASGQFQDQLQIEEPEDLYGTFDTTSFDYYSLNALFFTSGLDIASLESLDNNAVIKLYLTDVSRVSSIFLFDKENSYLEHNCRIYTGASLFGNYEDIRFVVPLEEYSYPYLLFTTTSSERSFNAALGVRISVSYGGENSDSTTDHTVLVKNKVYAFKEGSIGLGTTLEFNNECFMLDSETAGWFYDSQHPYSVRVRAIEVPEGVYDDVPYKGYQFLFSDDYTTENVSLIKVYNEVEEIRQKTARCIQLFKFNTQDVQDIFLPPASQLIVDVDSLEEVEAYSKGSIVYAVTQLLDNLDNYLRFKNWQYFDTGYRMDSFAYNKRYREVQFQISNPTGQNLDFGLEFQIDGQPRLAYLSYDVEHIVDPDSPDFGLIYVQGTADMNLHMAGSTYKQTQVPQSTVLGVNKNVWQLDQSLFPSCSFWKVRTPVSGKGLAPRVRLLSRNIIRYELLGLNWVYRLMNTR